MKDWLEIENHVLERIKEFSYVTQIELEDFFIEAGYNPVGKYHACIGGTRPIIHFWTIDAIRILNNLHDCDKITWQITWDSQIRGFIPVDSETGEKYENWRAGGNDDLIVKFYSTDWAPVRVCGV